MTQAEIYDNIMVELADIKTMLVELGATDPSAPAVEQPDVPPTEPSATPTKKSKDA